MLSRTTGRTVPANTPSFEELKFQLKETRQRLDALVTERASLALPAASGDKTAVTRITEIDTERSGLASRVETLEQALGALRQQATDPLERQRRGFEQDFDRRVRNVRVVVLDQIESLTRHVEQCLRSRDDRGAARAWQGELHSPNANYSQIDTPEHLIDRLARAAARQVCWIQDADLPDTDQFRQRRIAALALQDEMVNCIVVAVEVKPPAHLIDAHNRLVRLIETETRKARDVEERSQAAFAAESRRIRPLSSQDK